MAKDLLAKGANIEAKSKNGDSAFLAAARSGQVDILKLLLTQGADLSQVDALGTNALHQAAGAAKGDAVRFLLSKGLDPKIKDNQGRMAKEFVDQSNAPEIAELF